MSLCREELSRLTEVLGLDHEHIPGMPSASARHLVHGREIVVALSQFSNGDLGSIEPEWRVPNDLAP